MDDAVSERIEGFEADVSSLFSRINLKITNLGTQLDDLESRITIIKEKIKQLATQQDRTVTVCSPSNYPIDNSHLEHESIKFRPRHCGSANWSGPTGKSTIVCHTLTPNRIAHSCKVDHMLVDEMNKALKPLEKARESLQRPFLHQLSSVSSLLVLDTSESRLSTKPQRENKSSLTEDSSLLDRNSTRTRTRSFLTVTERSVARTRSSGREEVFSDLGPVPDSILKYREPEVIDQLDISALSEEEELDQLTSDLPETLPSLLEVFSNVHNDKDSTMAVSSPRSAGSITGSSGATSKSALPPLPPPPPPSSTRLSDGQLSASSTSVAGSSQSLSKPRDVSSRQSSAMSESEALLIPVREALMAEIRAANMKPIAKRTISEGTPHLDPRGSLLASIRNAAGKPQPKKNNKSKSAERLEVSTGAADPMFDLVSKLRARRDGISGSFKISMDSNESPIKLDASANSLDIQRQVLNKVSSMIPELEGHEASRSSALVNSSYEDNDWD